MKFNGTELGIISTQWNSTFEGVLLLKQRSDSFFKRSGNSAFAEYWCRLKGNLMVILRTNDHHSKDILGVVLLEHCSVGPTFEADVQHAFRIDFNSGDPSLLLAARSAAEAKMWCNHISSAGLSELSARRLQLREELQRRTGKDPLNPLSHSIVPTTDTSLDADEFSSTGLELQFSLILENSSVSSKVLEPNLSIVVSIQSGRDNLWTTVAETEIENEISPTFLKTVKLNSEKCEKASMIKFSLLEFKDLRSSASRVVRSASTTPKELCNTPFLRFDVTEHETDNAKSVVSRTLVVQVKKHSYPLNGIEIDNHSQQLRNVCENILTRNYVFHHTLGESMRVVEFMGESKLNLQLPIEYVKFLITQQHLLYDSLSRTGMSRPTLECLRKERLLGMKDVIERYEVCLRTMVDRTGLNFKRSTERNVSELDFVPTNLHTNRIGLLHSNDRLLSFADIISVGAFSSALTKYKCKGLFSTALLASSNASSEENVTPAWPRLAVVDVAPSTPTVAAALQLDANPVGLAMRQLVNGAFLLVQIRGDLRDLSTRLHAVGQATLLAQRLDNEMSAFNQLNCEGDLPSTSQFKIMKTNYDTLLHNIVEFATLESLESAEMSIPKTKPAQNVSNRIRPKAIYNEIGDLMDKTAFLTKITEASAKLVQSLGEAWQQVEERLWTRILDVLVDLASAASGADSVVPALTSSSQLWDNICYRHHASVCQALTASLSGVLVSVTSWSTIQWKQMIRCGVPLHFEGLLSCYGEEMTLLENWAWGAQSLSFWRIVLRPDSSPTQSASNVSPLESSVITNTPTPPLLKITCFNECELVIPRTAWENAPIDHQARGRITLSLHPYSLNVGINEQQTVAEKLERIGVQNAINAQGIASLQAYFDKYTHKFGAPAKTAKNEDVCDLLSSLRHIFASNRSKPVEMLELAARISRSLNAIRLTSCKSAKDRTSMSVTLEQVRWLRDVEGLQPDSFNSTLKCLRSTGLRLCNVEKNVNSRKYAFTRLQLMSFPRKYKPPPGTFSLHVAS